jgi:hypothetical protein
MTTPKSFWSYQASTKTPTLDAAIKARVIAPATTEAEWQSLSPGMRREIMRGAKWRNPTGRADFENALDTGQLFCAMGNGKFWQARRNGATRSWKRDVDRFYIPIKVGLRAYHAIKETDNVTNYRIAASRDDAEIG